MPFSDDLDLKWNRTRATFQRISDAKILRGWVYELRPGSVCVQAAINTAVLPNEEFTFQLFGDKEDAFFVAKLSNIDSGQTDVLRSLGDVDVKYVGVDTQIYIFNIVSRIRYAVSKFEGRYAVDYTTANISMAGGQTFSNIDVKDVSEHGIGIELPDFVKKGETASLMIQSANETLAVSACVVYCRPIKGTENYRTGFKVTEMSRLANMHWRSMLRKVRSEAA